MKSYLNAFIAGGILGVVAQVIVTVYMAIGIMYPVNVMVFTMGLLGAIFSYLGIFQKIAPHAGIGVDMPMFGLAGGITSRIIQARKDGKPLGEAIMKDGMLPPVLIFGIGGAICLVFAVIVYFIG